MRKINLNEIPFLYRLFVFTLISLQYCTIAVSEPIFIDATESAGITFLHTDGRSGVRLFNEFLGSGGGFFDYDGDGDLDIYLINGAIQTEDGQDQTLHNVLYRNDGDKHLHRCYQ